ncbi:MAG: phage major capsid protein [Lactococcus chungangensis]|uniref:Phage major capsid protein n=1 Tax=Pseudolactococcus chungangensis TaxID=451457 RepID=A0A847J1P9_9LACT|nr:phage major capsid protein [Lactococcus chungangensis]
MALKQLILSREISDRSNELSELLEQRSSLEKREEEITRALEEAVSTEDVNQVAKSADDLEKEIKDLDEQIKKLEDEKAGFEKELESISSSGNSGATDTTEKGGNRSMKNKNISTREGGEKLEQTRSAINAFIHSKGAQRASTGFTSVEGGALIPEELLAPELVPEDVVSLKKYVNVIQVNTASGKYPVISKSGNMMATVAELQASPKLANPTLSKIDFSIETRRGYIPISQEIVDDATYDVTGLIADEITDQALNTTNKDIATVLKTATAKAVVGVDGIKDTINVAIKRVYNVKLIVSASLYNELDKLKDNNGRYLLQDSITSASGKTLLGKEVVVLDDEIIGTASGDLVGFLGDPKAFMSYFDRKQTTVAWIDNQIYGKLLAGIIRYDVKKTDAEAGFYITYTNVPAGA